MNKFSKVGITLAAVGGTLLMAAPMALASSDPAGAQINGAVNSQWQSGAGGNVGTIMGQSSNLSTGQLSATGYSNNSSINPSSSSNWTYTSGADGGALATYNTSYSDGSHTVTTAAAFNTAGASVVQNQSQVVTLNACDDKGWTKQGEMSGAVSGTVDGDMNISGGLAGNIQYQKGSGEITSQMSNVQTGNTNATFLNVNSTNNPSGSTSLQYLGNTLVTKTTQYSAGSSDDMSANSYSNPTASVSQDQNQVIGYSEGSTKQYEGSVALSGNVTDEFWKSL